MRERAISAAVLVPIVAIPFVLGNPWLTFAVAALALLGGAEAASLVRRAGLPADPGIPILLAPLAVLGTLFAAGRDAAAAGAVLIVAVAALASFRKTDLRWAFLGWVGGSFGALWLSLIAFVPLVMAIAPPIPHDSLLFGKFDAGRVWLLCLVLTVWACDTFAYLVGRNYPRGRMLPRLSPNKTWSGAIGGTIAATVTGAVLFSVLAGVHPLGGALIGAALAVSAQVGDAAESLVKRAAGAKDSGTLVPGHGGILDRIDSFLFAAPALYLLLSLGSVLAIIRPA